MISKQLPSQLLVTTKSGDVVRKFLFPFHCHQNNYQVNFHLQQTEIGWRCQKTFSFHCHRKPTRSTFNCNKTKSGDVVRKLFPFHCRQNNYQVNFRLQQNKNGRRRQKTFSVSLSPKQQASLLLIATKPNWATLSKQLFLFIVASQLSVTTKQNRTILSKQLFMFYCCEEKTTMPTFSCNKTNAGDLF